MKLTRRSLIVKGAGAGAGAYLGTKLVLGDIDPAGAQESEEPVSDEWVPTACWIGKQDCGMLAHRVGGRIVKFEGNPSDPRNAGTLCPKGMAQIVSLYDPARLKTPLVRTNEKGVTGTWREASWDEALTLVADRVTAAREADPASVLWQKGRSKAKLFYDDALTHALGSSKLGHGAYCSDAGYRAVEYTIGLHGVLHPDFRHTRYLLCWGWNVTSAGGNKFCWITWNRQLVEARKRGLEIVVIDPRQRGAGPFTDRWLPIRPSTDMALALALANAILERGEIDTEYLTRFTNAPFLVGADGKFLRIDDKEQIWAGGPQPYDTSIPARALEGEYTIGGETLRPAFQVLREHLAQYTPEWAAEICGLTAEQIRELAGDLVDNAQLGSTIELDGTTLPYRPVSVMAYHMAQQELGMQTVRAMLLPFMLLGAVGAAGGVTSDTSWKVHDNWLKNDQAEISDSPNFYLKGSKYFPINTGSPSVAAMAASDADRFEPGPLPEVVIVHMTNPLGAYPDRELTASMYEKFPFVVDINPWLSETADRYADVILPAATIEKYEGPISMSDQYTDAVGLRLPPIEPLYQSRGEIDIYLDLAERVGVLYGEGGYLDEVNVALGLTEVEEVDEETEVRHPGPYALPLDVKPTVREIYDRWAKSQGIEEGVAYFEQNGVQVKGPVAPTKLYGYATDPPFGGAVPHRLYGESLLRYREEMQAAGVEELFWQDYTALPTWRTPTMEGSPAEFDLTLISYKLIEHKQSRTAFVPVLQELAPEQRLTINPETARVRGIEDGDEVWVESHNAVTGQMRRVKTKAALSAGIRPDVVGMFHHFGLFASPRTRDAGPSANELLFSGPGYVANTGDQSFQAKVRVYRT